MYVCIKWNLQSNGLRVYVYMRTQIENVEKFLHHVNVTMRQKHHHLQLSLVADRIESYDAVDAPSDECDKVCMTSDRQWKRTAWNKSGRPDLTQPDP